MPLDLTTDQFDQLYVSDPAGGRIIVYGQAPVPTARVSWGQVKSRYAPTPQTPTSKKNDR